MKKKKTGLIITTVIVLLCLAAGGFFAWNRYTQVMEEKQNAYNQAEAYLATGNYRDAYRSYLQLEDFADASEKAVQVQQMMADAAAEHIAVAQHYSDLKFNTIAGLYLTEVLADENLFTLDDYNEMAAMIGSFYDLAAQQYTEVMTIDDKQTKTIMDELMPRIEALEESRNPQDAMQVISELTTFSLADQVFLHCWQNGTFADTTLDALAEHCPVWVPVMDQVIASEETLDVIALINRG